MKYLRHIRCVLLVGCLCIGPAATGSAGIVQEVKDATKNVWSDIKQAAKDTGKAVKDGAVKVGKGAKKGYRDTKETIKESVKGETQKGSSE